MVALTNDLQSFDHRIAELEAKNEGLCHQLEQKDVVRGPQPILKDTSIVRKGRTPLASLSPNVKDKRDQPQRDIPQLGKKSKAPLPLVLVLHVTKVCHGLCFSPSTSFACIFHCIELSIVLQHL